MQSLGGDASSWRTGAGGGRFTVDGGGSANAPTTSGPAALPFPMQQQPLPQQHGANPYLGMLSSSFPQQLPAEWANSAALAHSYSGAPSPLAYPNYPNLYQSFPQSMPSNGFPGSFAHLAATGQPLDPNLLALHMSLEAQAAQYRAAAPATSPLVSSSMPAPALSTGHRAAGLHGSSSTGPVRSSSSRKSSSSFVNAARASGSGGVTPRQRQPTNPSQPGSAHGSPLPSPSLLQSQVYGDAASYFSGPQTTHQRPVPPLPRPINLNTNLAGSAHSSTHPSPLGSPSFRSPTTSSVLSNSLNPFAPPSQQSFALASPASPHVDYDFSSLESDLDRFSSGGFASAAAAAMASVGPGQRSHTGVGGFGVGGYGSPSYSAGVEGAPSPKVLAEVLGESFTASLPPRSPGPSAVASPIDFSAFVAQSPAGSAASGSGVAGAASSLTRPSPTADVQPSPTGSTIIDEEGAEALSKKDPIAAQVWRMFNKAKNTMPNGARMENLTWRLMSMTLKKRREEAMSAEANSTAATVDTGASLKSAMEQEVKKQQRTADAKRQEDEAVQEEARDNVQELRSRSDSIRSDRTTSSAAPAAVETDEEERGRRRRTGGSTTPKSAVPSPEAAADDDAMDWRAKSQSRSRSRAPDTMDWRAQSRSRSRAPDFRVAVAPPTVDVATATANFSRFYGDGSGTTTPSGSNSSANSASAATTTVQDSRSAHLQLAASLGLSPSLVDSYGSNNGFDQSSMSSFAASTTSPPRSTFSSITSPPTSALPLSGAGSPGSFNAYSTSQSSSHHGSYVGSPSFSFPHLSPPGAEAPNGSDPNLAAIENTLNQLINLQSMASNGTGSPSNDSKSATTSFNPPTSLNGNKSPLDDYSSMPPPQSRKSNSDSYASLAQQQLQQLALQSRKSSYTSPSSAVTSPAGSSSSAYMNAASLAQSTRPFAFNSNPSPNASGISLGRPSALPDSQNSVPPSPAAFFSQPVSPFAYPSSAPGPGHAFVGSPAASLYGDPSSADPNQALYDYFAHQSQPHSGYASPFLPSHSFDNSAPTHVDPSQLLAHLQKHTALYEPEASPASRNSSSRTGTASPPDGQPTASTSKAVSKTSTAAAKARKATNMRISASSPDLVALGHAAKTHTASAPASRVHSRSNTISMPATVPEDRVVEPVAAASASAAAGSQAKTADTSGGDDSLTKCLNCSTTNTPLWRRDAEGRPLCNACGLFRNLHGVDRPANLNTGVIKKRNRARGKEGVPKKSSSSSRAAARRNSLGAASPPAPSARGAVRAGAPYPSTAARTSSNNNVHSATASAATSPSA